MVFASACSGDADPNYDAETSLPTQAPTADSAEPPVDDSEDTAEADDADPADDAADGTDEEQGLPDPWAIPEVPTEPTEFWSITSATGGTVEVSTIPTGGDAVILQLGSDFALVDIETGEERWRRAGADSPSGWGAAQFVVPGAERLVAITGRDGPSTTWATFDLTDGSELASTTLSDSPESTAVLEQYGGALLLHEWDAASGSSMISRVDLDTLESEWTFSYDASEVPTTTPDEAEALPDFPPVTPTSDPALLRVATETGDGEYTLEHLDLDTGQITDAVTLGPVSGEIAGLWTQDVLVASTTTDANEVVLTGWSLADGGELWDHTADLTAVTVDRLEPAPHGPGNAEHLTGVFVGIAQDPEDLGPGQLIDVERLDPTRGEPIWDEPARGTWSNATADLSALPSQLAVRGAADTYVIVEEIGTDGGRTWDIIAADDGDRLGSHEFAGDATVTLGSEHFYRLVPSWEGNMLYGYSDTGEDLWQIQLNSGRPRFHDGAIFVTDQTTGTIRRLG